MKSWLAGPWLLMPAYAHMLSMSTGDIRVEGSRAHYELRMPVYEIAHVKDPEHALLRHIRFTGGGGEARRVSGSCRREDSYICEADYEFPSAVDRLDVECTLPAATVASHVHLLRAEKDGLRDQAMFDVSFSKASLRFRPPTPLEAAAAQTGAGMVRALGGFVQILFLAALVLAARNRLELIALAATFLAGQSASALVVPYTGWQAPTRFIEAAAALTVAYLAVDVLLLPTAGRRWLIAGALGAFHGLYFEAFLRNSGYHPGYVLAGAAVAETVLIILFAAVARFSRVTANVRPVQVSASLLLVIGMVWFLLGLR